MPERTGSGPPQVARSGSDVVSALTHVTRRRFSRNRGGRATPVGMAAHERACGRTEPVGCSADDHGPRRRLGCTGGPGLRGDQSVPIRSRDAPDRSPFVMPLTPCRECARSISTEALTCPRCGVPNPGRDYRRPAPAHDAPQIAWQPAGLPARVTAVAAPGVTPAPPACPDDADECQEYERPSPAFRVTCAVEFVGALGKYRVTLTTPNGMWRVLRSYLPSTDVLDSLLREFRGAAERDFYEFWQRDFPRAAPERAYRRYRRLRVEARPFERVAGPQFRWVRSGLHASEKHDLRRIRTADPALAR